MIESALSYLSRSRHSHSIIPWLIMNPLGDLTQLWPIARTLLACQLAE